MKTELFALVASLVTLVATRLINRYLPPENTKPAAEATAHE